MEPVLGLPDRAMAAGLLTLALAVHLESSGAAKHPTYPVLVPVAAAEDVEARLPPMDLL